MKHGSIFVSRTGSRLIGAVCKPSELGAAERLMMFCILERYFEGVRWRAFTEDLEEKDAVIVMYAKDSSKIVGFSTQRVFQHYLNSSPCLIVFSGDTIIDQAYWGSLSLPLIWSEWTLSLKKRAPEIPIYWMLISKGIRTYRFLPAYFNSFFPHFDRETPEIFQQLMHELGNSRFGRFYDSQRGIVTVFDKSYRLKPQYAEVPPGRTRNPHIRFFLESNPGYLQGEELLCLTEVCPDNLKVNFNRRLSSNRQARYLRRQKQKYAA